MSESTGRRYKRYKDPMDAPYRPDKIKIPAKPKQTGAPKRPMSAYFLFAGDQRQAVKDANPELPLTEIAKILGADWGKASKREKKKYLDEAGEKLGDYKEKRAEYEASSKYKLWKKKTAEWNDLYKEDWDEQQFEKEENKKKKLTKANKKKKTDKKGGRGRKKK